MIALGKEKSGEKIGKEISILRLKEIFLELQSKRANNINLVTGTHYIPQIVQALQIAKAEGLKIPIVYNTGGYEKVESLRLLDGLVDIYLPDMKYVSKELSKEYSNAPDYFDVASKALAEMVENKFPALKGNLIINNIGTTIGSHSGPGTVAVFFWGDERKD